jgi:hypothetical protein
LTTLLFISHFLLELEDPLALAIILSPEPISKLQVIFVMLWVLTSKLGARDHFSVGLEPCLQLFLQTDEVGENQNSFFDLLLAERKGGSLHVAIERLELFMTSLSVNVGGGSVVVLVLDAVVGVGKIYNRRVRVWGF